MTFDSGRALRITNWDRLYENNRTRQLKRLDWVPVPNRMDGDGYTEFVDHPNGAAHYGAWLAILQIASRCDPRGTLMRDRARPHTPQSLARISRFPAVIFEQALPRLMKIGWLEFTDDNPQGYNDLRDDAEIPQDSAEIPQDSAGSLRDSDYGMEGKGMKEGNSLVIEFPENSTIQPSEHVFSWIDQLVQDFLDLYPNRIGVDEAARMIVSLAGSEITESAVPEILAGLQRWKDSEQWAAEGGKFIPAPAKWIGARRWKDFPKPKVDDEYHAPPPSADGGNPFAVWEPEWLKRGKPND
jgi:hypothetical protein